jgi:hypothetical protein
VTTPQSGDPIGTPRGFGRVLLVWGHKVRVVYCDHSRATYDISECIVANIEHPSASVTSLADYRRKRTIREVRDV